jgi:hypothetical protein
MGKIADIKDEQAKATVHVDDGRDWAKWLVWKSKTNYRRSNGVNELPPARPQVSPVRIMPNKKPRKRVYRVVEQAIGAV